jgi:hypothetical protein
LTPFCAREVDPTPGFPLTIRAWTAATSPTSSAVTLTPPTSLGHTPPTSLPRPYDDGDDRQDLVAQEVWARDLSDLFEERVRRVLPPRAAHDLLGGIDALDGQLPEPYRLQIVERIYETLEPLDK